VEKVLHLKDHHDAFAEILHTLLGSKGSHDAVIQHKEEISSVGHRVVHGGEEFSEPAIVDDEMLQKLEKVSELAPLHNPANVNGIKIARKIFENSKHVVVFDNSFHKTLPEHVFMYPLPIEVYKKGKVRKYGFHGTSHNYVSKQCAQFLNVEPSTLKLITLHLGNGCSACAIKHGKSIDTSMGLTPLEGLMMGTRSGSIDPAAVFYLTNLSKSKHKEKCDSSALQRLESMLNKKSGFKGICGESDLRKVLSIMKSDTEQGKLAKLAFEMFCYRIKLVIGSYFVALNGVDAIIFTAGIGENAVR